MQNLDFRDFSETDELSELFPSLYGDEGSSTSCLHVEMGALLFC